MVLEQELAKVIKIFLKDKMKELIMKQTDKVFDKLATYMILMDNKSLTS